MSRFSSYCLYFPTLFIGRLLFLVSALVVTWQKKAWSSNSVYVILYSIIVIVSSS